MNMTARFKLPSVVFAALCLGFGLFAAPVFAQDEAKAPTETAKEKTHYSHVSKKLGRTYFLFGKDVALKNSDKVQTIYYFSKDPNNKKGKPLAKVPDDRMVSETKTGMLVLKKKPAAKK